MSRRPATEDVVALLHELCGREGASRLHETPEGEALADEWHKGRLAAAKEASRRVDAYDRLVTVVRGLRRSMLCQTDADHDPRGCDGCLRYDDAMKLLRRLGEADEEHGCTRWERRREPVIVDEETARALAQSILWPEDASDD